uniref:Glycerol operon regulatory protein n=1 Tax=Thermogemmatispora argillosa TaxID=2045280 RepID=A0A455T142_9CHLR|nr:IclR family transcriptional regulator [Thermogemmatispora argillosa]
MVQSVYKAFQILNLFSHEQPEWGVCEIARKLGFPKSTASALAASLTEGGLLRRTPTGRYRLGWRIVALSQLLLETTEFRSEARKVMESLVARFGETVHLATLESDQIIYVEKLQGTRAVRVAVTGVGVRLPGHCSGVGKCILAHLPWERVQAILEKQGLPALTPNTITDPQVLRAELEQVRRQGYAYDREEAVLELCCVAAPIRDHSGEVIAAMSLSIPAYRFYANEEQYRLAIVRAAQQVSENLGYIPRIACSGKRRN